MYLQQNLVMQGNVVSSPYWLDAFLRGSLSFAWPQVPSGRSSFSRIRRVTRESYLLHAEVASSTFKREFASYSLQRAPSRCSRCPIRRVANPIRRYNIIIIVIIVFSPHLWSKMGRAPLVKRAV